MARLYVNASVRKLSRNTFVEVTAIITRGVTKHRIGRTVRTGQIQTEEADMILCNN